MVNGEIVDLALRNCLSSGTDPTVRSDGTRSIPRPQIKDEDKPVRSEKWQAKAR
jgi:hypothetical protein